MNRRGFFTLAGGLFGIGAASGCCNAGACKPKNDPQPINFLQTQTEFRAPYIVSILWPENEKIELGPGIYPTFPNAKQAQNFASARMSIMRQNGTEAGKIIVMDATGQTVEESAWGETWSQTIAYV